MMYSRIYPNRVDVFSFRRLCLSFTVVLTLGLWASPVLSVPPNYLNFQFGPVHGVKSWGGIQRLHVYQYTTPENTDIHLFWPDIRTVINRSKELVLPGADVVMDEIWALIGGYASGRAIVGENTILADEDANILQRYAIHTSKLRFILRGITAITGSPLQGVPIMAVREHHGSFPGAAAIHFYDLAAELNINTIWGEELLVSKPGKPLYDWMDFERSGVRGDDAAKRVSERLNEVYFGRGHGSLVSSQFWLDQIKDTFRFTGEHFPIADLNRVQDGMRRAGTRIANTSSYTDINSNEGVAARGINLAVGNVLMDWVGEHIIYGPERNDLIARIIKQVEVTASERPYVRGYRETYNMLRFMPNAVGFAAMQSFYLIDIPAYASLRGDLNEANTGVIDLQNRLVFLPTNFQESGVTEYYTIQYGGVGIASLTRAPNRLAIAAVRARILREVRYDSGRRPKTWKETTSLVLGF